MDKISIFALLIGIVAILAGQFIEGAAIASLLQLTAFMIVMGGTLSAVLLQSTAKQFIHGVRMVKWIIRPPKIDFETTLQNMVEWTKLVRRNGLLVLESYIATEEHPFLQKGLQLLVDGMNPADIKAMLDIEIDMFSHTAKQAARIWEAAAGYAPTMGILGAVLGLIHVMENLTDPSKLGAGIAVAFVATVYGVGSANLLFMPIGIKLKHYITQEITWREMVLEGLQAIANGENPRLIESRLRGFWPAE